MAWVSEPDRKLEDVRNVATALLAGFLSHAVTLPVLPRLDRALLTAVRFRQVAEALFSQGSQGAFEQYLVAGVLRAEMAATGRAIRAETKSVKISDRSSGASGDVELRQGQALVEAIEVTAEKWSSKLSQIAAGAQRLDAVTVVARGVLDADAGAFEREVSKDPRLSGVDLRFVELMGLIDLCSSRLDGGGRVDALTFVYACLARWHRSEPALIKRLVEAVTEAGVVEEEAEGAEITPGEVEAEEAADAVARRLVARLQQGNFLADESVKADLKLLHHLATGEPE